MNERPPRQIDEVSSVRRRFMPPCAPSEPREVEAMAKIAIDAIDAATRDE